MKALIDVFRMNEIDPKIRAKIIIRLGRAINNEHQSNITEPLVFELVSVLEPDNKILTEEHYLNKLK